MLELLNVGHITTYTIKLLSCDKILLVTSWTVIMMSRPLTSNYNFLKRPEVANVADIMEIGIRNYVLKCNFYLYFLI